jgi:hypothetical protein
VAIIVKAPLIPIFAMIVGMMILALEVPLPIVKDFVLYRSFVVRVVLLFVQVVLNILYYQVSLYLVAMTPFQAHKRIQGTNAAIWSLIAAGCYCRAIILGETMKATKENLVKESAA